MLHLQAHFDEELERQVQNGSLDVMEAYHAMIPRWPQRKMWGFSYEADTSPVDLH